jgi:hypothetical protein
MLTIITQVRRQGSTLRLYLAIGQTLPTNVVYEDDMSAVVTPSNILHFLCDVFTMYICM